MTKYALAAAVLTGFLLTLALSACRDADQYPQPTTTAAPTTAPAATTTAP